MVNSKYHILWADDEIDLLKPHLLFLKTKGCEMVTANNGSDALDIAAADPSIDLVILDENMPGLTGLETLQKIKEKRPELPVVMITKSEEENIMDQAVGNKIADYLIKPVNPNQILLAIKKLLQGGKLVQQQTTIDYRQEFGSISQLTQQAASIDDWCQLYSKIVYWDMKLASTDTNMDEMLAMQRDEANNEFAKFVKRNYEKWVSPEGPTDAAPLMSPRLIPAKVFPLLEAGEKVFMVVIDNFRLDQWRAIAPLLAERFSFEEELYCSILPTATQYARNAIFSGLMPGQIEKMFPELWVDEDSPEGKNLNESPLVATMLERYRKRWTFSYSKLNDSAAAEKLVREFRRFDDVDLNVVVVNFIDMLSHARTDSKMIRELASSNAAYRSLTESWFRHSPILDLFGRIADSGRKVVLTTDHGTQHVDHAIKVVGDKNTNTNLRYKVGKSLAYNPKQVYEMKSPAQFGLPVPNISSAYIYACGHDFFAYPNNYNHYVQYYTGTFQHGGISMEEMLVPIIKLTPK